MEYNKLMKKHTHTIVALLVVATTFFGCAAPQQNNPPSSQNNNTQEPKPEPTQEPKPAETTILYAYFSNTALDPDKDFSCTNMFPVQRNVPKTTAVGLAAVTELLKGPTDAEKAKGYSTNINPGVKIQKLTIENGVAKIDFNEQLQYQVGGSCRTSAIYAQITKTLKQFPTVKKVVVSINGQTEDILQP